MRIDRSEQDLFGLGAPIFGDFQVLGLPFEERSYASIPSRQKLRACIADYLEQYNMTSNKGGLTLFLFDQALDNMVKVARVLRASHGLMIGLSGVGKQTTVRLSAFIA